MLKETDSILLNISFVSNFVLICICFCEDKEDPRYTSEKATLNMRQTLSALGKNTHKFIQQHNDLTGKAEHLKYKSYVEERGNYRSGSGVTFSSNIAESKCFRKIYENVYFLFSLQDPRFHTSSVRQELNDTISKLLKTTHNFVRQHDELANRAEYLKYKDFVSQREKH